MDPEPASEDGPASASRQKVYSVPRRYDLASLFVISGAYAILFGFLRLCYSPPVVFAVVAGFFTWVALAQAVLFKGRRPRTASVVAGMVFFITAAVVGPIVTLSMRPVLYAVFESLCASISGAIAGYAAGALIGGVFLVADLARKWASRRTDR